MNLSDLPPEQLEELIKLMEQRDAPISEENKDLMYDPLSLVEMGLSAGGSLSPKILAAIAKNKAKKAAVGSVTEEAGKWLGPNVSKADQPPVSVWDMARQKKLDKAAEAGPAPERDFFDRRRLSERLRGKKPYGDVSQEDIALSSRPSLEQIRARQEAAASPTSQRSSGTVVDVNDLSTAAPYKVSDEAKRATDAVSRELDRLTPSQREQLLGKSQEDIERRSRAIKEAALQTLLKGRK